MAWLLTTLGGSNRFSGRDVAGIVVVGDVSGIVIQNTGTGPPPDPLSVPWRDLPTASGPLGELGIFNLLTWRSRLADTLVGRDADRDRLIAWARSDPRPIAIRLLTGLGGAGKSRLAAEVATLLRDDKWSAGLISLEKASHLPLANRGLFVVIDYPEVHRAAVRAPCCRVLGRWKGRRRKSACFWSAGSRFRGGSTTSSPPVRASCATRRRARSAPSTRRPHAP